MLLEKEKRLGGNSAKASSGINAWTSTRADAHANDTLATSVASNPTPNPSPNPHPNPGPTPDPNPGPTPDPNPTQATFVADTAKSALRDAGFAHTARMIELLASRSEAATPC